MAFIEYGGKRHVVPAGEMLVGTGADCHLRLEGAGITLRHAVLTTAPDLSVSIRKLQDGATVEVNGVQLGSMPQPLLHGDKVTLAGIDLLFVDERKSGSTQYVSAVKLQDLAGGGPKKPGSAAGKATAATGGRIVSLTDGREYQVIGGSLKFGRDASADVVVSGTQVSRRHAEIVVAPRGYIIVDSSTNGTFVNGERVQNQRLLARADVIRLGEEEFRFYADVAPVAAAPAAPAAPESPHVSPASPAPSPMVAQPVGAPTPRAIPVLQASEAPAAPESPSRQVAQSPSTPPGPPVAPPQVRGAAQLVSTGYFPSPSRPAPPPAPAAPPSPSRQVTPAPEQPGSPVAKSPSPSAPPAPPVPPAAAMPPAPVPPAAAPVPPAPAPAVPQKAPPSLAKFLIRTGSMKGQRLYVKVPIVNIGRAEYNDLVIPDDSVSSQHAKLTRREGVWMLTDVGSTNGTMVDGERITNDTPIAPGAFVRFGDIQLVFEPTDDDAGMEKNQGTRAISAVKLSDLKPPTGR